MKKLKLKLLLLILLTSYFSILNASTKFNNEKNIDKQSHDEQKKLLSYKKEILVHSNELLNNVELQKKLSKNQIETYLKNLEKQIEKSETIDELDFITLHYLFSLGSFVELEREKQSKID